MIDIIEKVYIFIFEIYYPFFVGSFIRLSKKFLYGLVTFNFNKNLTIAYSMILRVLYQVFDGIFFLTRKNIQC